MKYLAEIFYNIQYKRYEVNVYEDTIEFCLEISKCCNFKTLKLAKKYVKKIKAKSIVMEY